MKEARTDAQRTLALTSINNPKPTRGTLAQWLVGETLVQRGQFLEWEKKAEEKKNLLKDSSKIGKLVYAHFFRFFYHLAPIQYSRELNVFVSRGWFIH